ncbi:hypothetical protein B0I35DRAFT_438159 [Stachybotrys elegans]|uniref:F-box domain-containing protein n=1 Tax=Stachybotrys elegans TaxID=80388 RepID=A0A8K0SQR9_9HYPO|nr:hypothetical protein B0I35DRAFT_438159 [Stachybotrys elegans]
MPPTKKFPDRSVGPMLKGLGEYYTSKTWRRKNPTYRRWQGSLPLGIVMGGYHAESTSPLLLLPDELLSGIVDYLSSDRQSLANFALVNKKCRQLARSRQFTYLRFDYSNDSQLLFYYLAAEGMVRKEGGPLDPLNIGCCVRSVNFASNPKHLASAHPALWHLNYGHDSHAKDAAERIASLEKKVNPEYLALRDIVLQAMATGMPHLSSVIWEDSFTLFADFFRFLSRSTVEHLKLDKIPLEASFLLRPPLTPPQWPLRSLDIHVYLELKPVELDPEAEGADDSKKGSPSIHPLSRFYETLFRSCASTLECLVWRGFKHPSRRLDGIREEAPVDLASLRTEPIQFSRLECLRLCSTPVHLSGLKTLLSPSIRHLEMPVSSEREGIGRYLASEPHLEALESLVVTQLPKEREDREGTIEFIRRHAHIKKLFLQCHFPGEPENSLQSVISVFGGSPFDNLQSLYLEFDGAQHRENGWRCLTPTEVLSRVCEIGSLERLGLHLPSWLIDHEDLRRHLTRLQKLQTLVLRGNEPWEITEAAEATRAPPLRGNPAERVHEGVGDQNARQIEYHLRHALSVIEDYAKVLERLETMLYSYIWAQVSRGSDCPDGLTATMREDYTEQIENKVHEIFGVALHTYL